MLENSRVSSFFVGLLIATGLGTINGGEVPKTDGGSVEPEVKIVYKECTKNHYSDNKSAVTSKPSVDLSNGNGNGVGGNLEEGNSTNGSNSESSFKPILKDGVYKMDKDVTDAMVMELKNQLSLIPNILVKEFYGCNFKLQLYSESDKVSDNSHLSTGNGTLSITYKGVKDKKVVTEFAYFLEHIGNLSSTTKFKEVYEEEGKGINKTTKGYFIKSFKDFVLNSDSLSSNRPVTYKYFKDYFTVISGGLVEEDDNNINKEDTEDNSNVNENSIVEDIKPIIEDTENTNTDIGSDVVEEGSSDKVVEESNTNEESVIPTTIDEYNIVNENN